MRNKHLYTRSGNVRRWLGGSMAAVLLLGGQNALALDFNLGAIDPVSFNFSSSQLSRFSNGDTLGQIFGGVTRLKSCSILGCIDLGTIDTRTGARFSANTDIGLGYNFNMGLSLGAYDPTNTTLRYTSSFSAGVLGGDGFHSLFGTSRISRAGTSSSWSSGGPDVFGRFGVSADFRADFSALGYAGGRKFLDTRFSVNAGANLDLLRIDTRLSDPLQIAPSLLDALPSFGVTAEVTAGKTTLVRKTLGGGALVASLLNPLRTFSQSVAERGDGVVQTASLDILRAGIDVLKLSPATRTLLTGEQILGGGYSVSYDLAALELGVALGYSAEINYRGDIQGATLTFDRDVVLREKNGLTSVVKAGEVYAFTDINQLPDVQALGGGSVDVTLNLYDVALKRQVDHNITLTPQGTLTVLPKGKLLKNGQQVKVGKISLGIPTLAELSLKLDPGFAFPVGSSSDGIVIDNILGSTTQTHSLTLDAPVVHYFAYEGENFNEAINGFFPPVPTTTVVDPVTGLSRRVDVMRRDSGEQSRLLFSTEADRERALTTGNPIASSRSFQTTFFNPDPAIGRNLSIGSFGLENAPGHQKRDLQLDGYDFGGWFTRVRIEEGRMLHVLNNDYVGNYDSAGNVIALTSLANDGLLYIQARDPAAPDGSAGSTLWFNQAPVRTFTGTGTAVFDLKTRMRMFTSGLFYQGPGHTTIVTGADNYLWFYAQDTHANFAYEVNHNTTTMQNEGRFIARNGARQVFDYNGIVGEGLINRGEIISEAGGLTELRRLNGITNEGLIAARDGGRVDIDASYNATDKTIQLYNNSAQAGRYVADGVAADGTASLLDFRQRVFLRSGEHDIRALNGGELRFRDGVGKILRNQPDEQGRLNLFIGDGSRVNMGKSSFDGTLVVEAGGAGQFDRLSARTANGLDITNHGTLEFFTGWNGTIPEPERPAPLNPGPDYVAPVAAQPLSFANYGNVVVHSAASFNFEAEVRESSTAGVVLDIGGWDVRGNQSSYSDGQGEVNLKLTSLSKRYDETIAGGGITDRDFVTHNRSNIRLSDGATWQINYLFSGLNNPGTVRGFYKGLEETLRINEGSLSLSNQHWTSTVEFVNDGRRADEGYQGALTLENGSLFTVDRFVNRQGTTRVDGYSRLTATGGEYEINGGTVSLTDGGTLGALATSPFFTTSADLFIRAGNTIELNEQVETLADGTTRTHAARLSIQDPARPVTVSENRGTLIMNGAATSFTGLEYLGHNAAGASLVLDHGASLHLQYDANRINGQGFLNEGSVYIGAGSTLDVKGNSQQAGYSFGGRFIQSGDGRLTIARNGQLIARTLELTGTQKIIDNNGLLLVDEMQLLAGERMTGSGHVVGNFTAAAGAVVGPGNSPGTMTHVGNATYQQGSLLEMELLGYAADQFDSILVQGTLDIQNADLSLNFDALFTAIANDTWALFRVEQSVDINGDFLAGTGQLSGGFGNILVNGLGGFDGSAAARYGDLASGGTFLGALGDFDLFLFFGAGIDHNLVTLAFLDGQKPFQFGQAVPLPAAFWLLASGVFGLLIVARRGAASARRAC